MENSKEIKKLDEKELEKVNGGYWENRARLWFNKYQDELFRRADEVGKRSKLQMILRCSIHSYDKWTLDKLKTELSTFIDVSDLN